jgi:hypothetical protein
MLNYVLRGQRTVNTESIMTTFMKIYSGELFDTEGIWLPTRLLVFQSAQVLIATFLSYAFFLQTAEAAKAAGEAQDDLDPNLPTWAKQLVPTRQDVNLALYPATICSMLRMAILILNYIPRWVC